MTNPAKVGPIEVQVTDRKTARAFVDAYIAPYANEWERAERLPEELLERMAAAGLWAPFLPPEVGGAGMSMVTLGEVHEEVGRGCSSVRSLLTVHTMASWALQRWGTPDQKQQWAAKLASGQLLGAFCLSEPGAGSDTSGISTTAVESGGGWVINGTKKWITNGQRADLYLVFARTASSSIGAFLVPRSSPGVQVRPIKGIMGTTASMIAEITFTDVRLGPDAVLGPLGFTAGMVLTGTLDLGRYSVATGSVGIIQACLEASAAYAGKRKVNGTFLKDLPLIQAKLTDMVTDARAARLLVTEAGRLKDAGEASTIIATWVAKYFASIAAAKHATEAIQIHGAAGCSADYPVGRYYRDAKVMEIIEGSNEIQRMTIAGQADREMVL
ncbi:MAG TPA: acyl-CoA dehydrogenase family protein [Pseudonocardiaceae bacterium]|nr:acyl-CoA dehydrogenase family protein [Pseudonocardiaceae bacterium]